MAYAAITSLMGTLHLHFLQSQPRFPLQHKQEIVSLHENLGFLQENLDKSEIAAYDNAGAMKDLEAEMRDVSFKAEERIEMELTTIYLAKDSLQSSSIEACLLSLHGICNEAVKQTDYLKKKLIEIKSNQQQQLAKGSSSLTRWMRRRGLLLGIGSTSSQPADLERDNITVSKFSKTASMVGCDKEFKTIMDQLTRQSAKQLQVVSIVGMGGIGKTTLAQKVYEDPSIISYFYMRAWVTVSQEYNMEQMLRCLIGCIIEASRREQINVHEQRNPKDTLAEGLRKRLKGQRYLIVVDDIWSKKAWDSVKRCFPDDNNGSRILLTSRLKVAENASSGNSIINMPFLDANESWNLYCNVFGKMEFVLVFEQIGRDIVKKCKGLPLAITLVASLLSKTEEKVEKWKNVAKSVIGDSNEACSRVLYLSYNQLPHHLKACFLYFGVFREDYEIPVKKLVRLWAAEGLLRAVEHRNMEEVAMECLQDLVDRSLVMVNKQSYKGEMKRIRIHDLLRDLCLKEAERENLLSVMGDEKLPFIKRKSQHMLSKPCRWITDRWISDASWRLNNEIRSGGERFHKSHSLHSRFEPFDHSPGFSHRNVSMEFLFSLFKLLRVVDIECGFSFGYEVLNVPAILVHLRYFSLTYGQRYCDAPLRVKLFEHWNMQSFIVRGNFVTLDFSEASGIWMMPLLRDFCVEQIFSLETLSVVYKNLENISWLDPKLCTKDLFTRIPNLKKLGIDGGYTQSPACFYNFVHLGQLETLSIRRWRYLKHIPCSGIPWGTSFLPNLKKLKFFRTRLLPWSDMRLIGMLPNLEVLKLINACQGPTWEPYNGGFCRLKRLVIEDTLLKYWNAGSDHFPVLECLELRKCKYLQEIPSGFGDIITLALIQLNYCLDSLLTSAKQIQDERLNIYGNSILVRSENIRVMKEKLFEDKI